MLARWKLPPGVPADQSVKLRFRLDVAGSASAIELVRATSNALGASAIDALRAASPFPPLPDRARCLAQYGLTGRFTNPGAS
jgi:TonB family protein